ncbi:MAG: response regulator [Alphaproteobacteria bacterium]|nr:response regulator [Alphaproteobacteria bacterium]
MNLTTRLLLLVLIAVLPAIGIQAYNEYDLRKSREDDIRQRVVQITKQFGEEMGELREGARQLLLALGELPAVKSHDEVACASLLATLKRQYASYNLLAAADSEGQIFCSSAPVHDRSVAEQPFFRRSIAQAGDRLTVGNYWADPQTGQKAIHFGLRFLDEEGKVAGVVFVALDLEWLSEHLKERGLTPTQSILIADREGNIIARLPHPEQLVGKNMRKSHEEIMDGDKTGWEEAAGVDGQARIFGYVPAQLPPYDFFLSAGQSKAEAFAPIDNATRRGVALIVFGFLLATFAAAYGGRIFIRRPIDRLLEATGHWRTGNYHARVDVRDAGSEIGRLGLAFNDMADALAARDRAQKQAEEQLRTLNATLEERVERRTQELGDANQLLKQEIKERERAQAALLQAQKIEAIGQLTSGIAHDFNNLLTAVLGNLAVARRRVSDERVLKLIDAATRAGKRGAKLVGELLAFSRRQNLVLQRVEINELLVGTEELIERSLGSMVRFDKVLQPGLWPATADPGQIELAVLNLSINARDAMPEGGDLTITTANIPAGDRRLPADLEGDFVMVAVSDTGTGMTEEVRAKVFEPFFTTKAVGKGSGLGLSMVYGMVTQCHGAVRIDSCVGHGTTISMFFPRAKADGAALPDAPALAGSEAEAQHTGAKLLVVDDDPEVRLFAVDALRDHGFMVREAPDAPAALAMIEREDDIEMLITDYAMPTMTGAELARRAKQQRPDLPILLITGFANVVPGALAASGARILRKPFELPELIQSIDQGLSGIAGAMSSVPAEVTVTL